MSTYVKTKHDIGITNSSGTTIGLMLARDKYGVPVYSSYDDEFLASQFTSSTFDYNSLQPEKEIAIVRDNWIGGFGQEYDDSENKYFSSIGADLRFRNMAILSPSYTAVYANCEVLRPSAAGDTTEHTASTGDNYTCVDEIVANDVDYVYNDSNPSALRTDIYNFPAHWGAGTISKITVVARAKNTSTVGALYFSIKSGVTLYEDATPNSLTSSWAFFTKDFTINPVTSAAWTWADIDALQAGIRTTSGGGGEITSCSQFYVLVYANQIPYPTNAVASASIKFNNNEYVAMGDCLTKLNASGNGFTFLQQFPATITDLCVFGANLYIAIGYSDEYWYMNTSEAFTESNLANNTMKYFATVKGTADTLWGSDTVNTIRSTINPVNGGTAWSTQTTVDSSTYNMNELITRSNVLYIRKEDRPFYLDSTGDIQVLVEDTSFLTVSEAGKKATVFLDDIYMPWGDQSLLKWNTYDAIFEWLDPADFCTNSSEFVGKVQALTSDERYLFACVDYATKVEILAGRNESVDGTTDWRWHPLQEMTLTGVNIAFVSNVYAKRLWICSTAATEPIYYLPLTTKYGDITSDTNYTFLTGGYFVTSWHHCNFKSDYKAFIKMTLTTASCTSNVYWTASYQKLGDSSWTSIGNFTTSPTQTKYIPVDGSANKPKSTMMRFKFAATTNSTGTTPKLLAYDVRAILYPSNRRIIECEVLCDNDIVLIDGTVEKNMGATIKAGIEDARDYTYPLAFYDVGWNGSGDTIYVKLLPTKCALISSDKSPSKIERRYRLALQKVTIS